MTMTEHLYSLFLQHPQISTDTRKIAAGSLFFALKGDKFDANTFAIQAIEAGAAYAVIDNPVYKTGERLILVDDVLTALQDLARHHRRQLTIPVIGLTGTNGKTTTKELINSVLSQQFNTQATQGNLNNHIGVPLTILTINTSHQMAVIEMGANHQREIALLCSIALPTHGLITNVGKAHLEGFGGFEGVKKGKGELYEFLRGSQESQESPESPKVRKSESGESAEVGKSESGKDYGIVLEGENGIAFINSDNNFLLEMQQSRHLTRAVYYGTSAEHNLVSGRLLENAPYLTLEWANHQSQQSYPVKTQLTGAYNLDNILAAICIGVYFKLTDSQINRGIESYQPKNNRSQIMQTATNTLICDYYNANPSSMLVAIDNVGKIKADRKVLILGDMFELGDESAAEHETIIKKALDTPIDERIFVGKAFYDAGMEAFASESGEEDSIAGTKFYLTAEEAVEGIKAHPISHSTILIKGSRGMALERLVLLF
jgi:UDP-N-acetylmuramoyl-tripeptide--D-alanyl-D-alanine ligase